jgi:hypothetical protein
MKYQEHLPIIGWREWVSLPDIGILEVKAKIDTGARSSALHAFDIEKFHRQGKQMVRFKVHPYQGDTIRTVMAEAELIDQRKVRSSDGRTELRPVIRTMIELLGDRWPIEVTLTNRDLMYFRLLLGRQAVGQLFLVDAGHSFLRSAKQGYRPQEHRN